MFAQIVDDVGFTDFNNGNGGNYELLQTNSYKNMASDGKDLGADIVGLSNEFENVE